MSIEQGTHNGFVHTDIWGDGNDRHCLIWLADDTGKASSMVVGMDAADCRNLADTLIEYAKDMEVCDAATEDM